MKKAVSVIQNSFINGVIFLLPILIVIALIKKAMVYLKGFSTKISDFFGIGELFGFAGHTIVSSVSIIIICILLGLLVKLNFMKQFRDWLDERLGELLPGYESYRESALKKLKKEPEKLPYELAVLVKENERFLPGFLMNTLSDGRHTIFIPAAGQIEQGKICIEHTENVRLLPQADLQKMIDIIKKKGAGMESLILS